MIIDVHSLVQRQPTISFTVTYGSEIYVKFVREMFVRSWYKSKLIVYS